MGIFNAILGNASEVNTENLSKEFEPLLIDNLKFCFVDKIVTLLMTVRKSNTMR